MTFRFPCSSTVAAKEIVTKLINSDYEIEIAFYFAGFKQITTNFISITSGQLQNILSKTIADGKSNNAQYIHRRQSSSFIGKYTTNVNKMIYSENPNAILSAIMGNLEDQFISLLEQGNR
ncbi:unnamed protein product [Didymodactylos carnosus]|uniref:Uncharacterized protein n=1 Tax=Didymodactylos carnosus TaxID=1234261 RepID=A0A814Z0Y1_9BILA|nr:unnamed protein product [Didymodactylos carnosus]CAF4000811.1 unnamed protein product [Didymodactylos carnosus]